MSDPIILAIEQAAEKLERVLGLCEDGLLRIDEAQGVIRAVQDDLRAAIPQQDRAYRVLERAIAHSQPWFKVTRGNFVVQSDCSNLKYWVDAIEELGREYAPDFIRHAQYDKRQYFIGQGERLKGQQVLFNTMKRATRTLDIIEPYLDDTFFPYVQSLDPGLKVRALAGPQPKSIVKVMYAAYGASASNLEIRTDATFHNRYLIVDEREVWDLGTSINSIGKKAFTISKITDPAEQARILSEFRAVWAVSPPL